MSFNSLSRAVFLSLVFPRIIKAGRQWYSPSPAATLAFTTADETSESAITLPESEIRNSYFDLIFLRSSLVMDAFLTGMACLASRPAHLFWGAAPFDVRRAPLTPRACYSCWDHSPRVRDSRSLQRRYYVRRSPFGFAFSSLIPPRPPREMVPASQATDALSALALVEMVAMVSTVSLFGAAFAALSDLGLAGWTFGLNSVRDFALTHPSNID